MIHMIQEPSGQTLSCTLMTENSETKFLRYEIRDLGRGYKISSKASRVRNGFSVFLSIVIFLNLPAYDAHKAFPFSVKDTRSRILSVANERVESFLKLRLN